MTYRMFSTFAKWLPEAAEVSRYVSVRNDMGPYLVDDVALAPSMAVVGGDDILEDPRLKDLLTNRHTAKINKAESEDILKEALLVSQMRADFQQIGLDSLVGMLERLDFESNNHKIRRAPSNNPMFTMKEIRKQMTKVSAKEVGFIMCLMDDPFPGDLAFCKPTPFDPRYSFDNYAAPPQMITEEEDEDDEDGALTIARVGAPPDKRALSKHHKNGGKVIALTATYVLNMLHVGMVRKSVPTNAFSYKEAALCADEIAWLEARTTEQSVLQLISAEYAERDKEVFSLVHFPDRSLFDIKASEEELAKILEQQREAKRIGEMILMSRNACFEDGTEVVSRPQFVSTVTKPKKTLFNASMVQKFKDGLSNVPTVMCNVGQCVEVGYHSCQANAVNRCVGVFCETHKKHKTHGKPANLKTTRGSSTLGGRA